MSARSTIGSQRVPAELVARCLGWDVERLLGALEGATVTAGVVFPSAVCEDGMWWLSWSDVARWMGVFMGVRTGESVRLMTVNEVARAIRKPLRTVRRWLVVERRCPVVVLPDESVRVRVEDFCRWTLPVVKRGRPRIEREVDRA